MSNSPSHIAVVFASLRTGGAERAMVNLANGFNAQKIKTDIVVTDSSGEFHSHIHPGVNLVDLKLKHARYGIRSFRNYLIRSNPDVLIVAQLHIQLMVLVAIMLTKWKGILILNEQSTFSLNSKRKMQILLASFLFKRANAITTVSQGSADDFAAVIPSLKNRVSVISNPVFSQNITGLKNENVSHPFFDDKKIPVVLSAGRLSAVKNYTLLLDAFALVLKKTDARLIILGEGDERNKLLMHAERLGISNTVSFPGNVMNPYSYMNVCDVFVLSSLYEGLPSVLIEALACGCRIVSSDCKSGPAEILENGKYGSLVPVNDAVRMSEEILKAFSSENRKEDKLVQAKKFNVEVVTRKYLDLIKKLSA